MANNGYIRKLIPREVQGKRVKAGAGWWGAADADLEESLGPRIIVTQPWRGVTGDVASTMQNNG